MTRVHRTEFLDGCHMAETDETVGHRRLIIANGVHYSSAQGFMGCIEEYGAGHARVCMMLAMDHEDGLYIGLTPDGARNYAAALIKMANMVDAQVAAQATAAIEAARKTGGAT